MYSWLKRSLYSLITPDKVTPNETTAHGQNSAKNVLNWNYYDLHFFSLYATPSHVWILIQINIEIIEKTDSSKLKDSFLSGLKSWNSR